MEWKALTGTTSIPTAYQRNENRDFVYVAEPQTALSLLQWPSGLCMAQFSIWNFFGAGCCGGMKYNEGAGYLS